jgi:hypothetical protein
MVPALLFALVLVGERAAGVGVALALLPRVRLELVCGTALSPHTAVAIALHNLPN